MWMFLTAFVLVDLSPTFAAKDVHASLSNIEKRIQFQAEQITQLQETVLRQNDEIIHLKQIIGHVVNDSNADTSNKRAPVNKVTKNLPATVSRGKISGNETSENLYFTIFRENFTFTNLNI